MLPTLPTSASPWNRQSLSVKISLATKCMKAQTMLISWNGDFMDYVNNHLK